MMLEVFSNLNDAKERLEILVFLVRIKRKLALNACYVPNSDHLCLYRSSHLMWSNDSKSAAQERAHSNIEENLFCLSHVMLYHPYLENCIKCFIILT